MKHLLYKANVLLALSLCILGTSWFYLGMPDLNLQETDMLRMGGKRCYYFLSGKHFKILEKELEWGYEKC